MSNINTAVVGSGGREFELGRQLGLSDEVQSVYFLDGNAGTDDLPKGENVPIKPPSVDEVVRFADENQVRLTVIGPEAPLVAGVADRLREKGLVVFGPNAEPAKLEASKAYATTFMEENGIPHPPAVITHSYEEAMGLIGSRNVDDYVIKADGLAGGKGVVLPESSEDAEQTLRKMFLEGGFDGAGRETVLIQERYHGPEVSAFVVSDGSRFVVLPLSQDHKRLLNGDKGPNTGGMGAFSPLSAEIVSAGQEQKINEIAERSIEGMALRGTPYQGVLYVGLMLAEELGGDPVVIEYNARFGDPETQVVLPLLSEAGVDVYDMLRSSAEGRLSDIAIPRQLGSSALTVCLAAKGYPDSPEKGQDIYGLGEQYESVILHHAGTKKEGEAIKTAGGRVLYVTGVGETVDVAAQNAYNAIGRVGFADMQYRDDIGHQARK